MPLDKALVYAAEDADITLRLYLSFNKRLIREKMITLYETIERPLPYVISNMERNGVGIDPLYLKNLSALFCKALPYEKKIFTSKQEKNLILLRQNN